VSPISSAAEFRSSLVLGLAVYLPTAFLAYAVLVAIGHRIAGGGAHLTLPAGDGTAVIPPEEIEWIEAANNMVRIHAHGRVHMARRPLNEVARELDPGRFVRVHRSHIVAVSAVRELRPRSHGDAEVLLSDGTALRVTRSRRAKLEASVRGGAG
jgi:DNA-binding LytR/AlgR family response regulator